jgi:hypothetical protein
VGRAVGRAMRSMGLMKGDILILEILLIALVQRPAVIIIQVWGMIIITYFTSTN